MTEYKKQRLLSDIVNELLNTEPQKVTEVKCSDGQFRNRPLIDIAVAVEIVNSFRETNMGAGNETIFETKESNSDLQSACRIIRDELLKHGDFYKTFVSSVQSAIREVPDKCWSNELAEKIVKRISGEE